MIGPVPYVYGGGKQPARINIALCGRTGRGRKGTAKYIVADLIKAIDSEFWAERHKTGLSSGEGVIDAVADKRITDEDGNTETVPVDKRLLVIESEFSKVLAQTKREGNILSQILRESFDSGDLGTLTVNPRQAHDAHICIIGHITVEELQKRMSEIEMVNGFGNRFLWFFTHSQKFLPEAKPPKITLFAAIFKDRLKWAKSQRQINIDSTAMEVWKRVYPFLCSTKPGLQGAMLARGESIVLRVALIYALLDRSKLIKTEHLEAALAVWQYNEESVRLIFANKVGESGLQTKLFELLSSKGPLTKSEMFSHIGNVKADEIDAALAYLQSINRVKCSYVKPKGPGRPSEKWEAATNA